MCLKKQDRRISEMAHKRKEAKLEYKRAKAARAGKVRSDDNKKKAENLYTDFAAITIYDTANAPCSRRRIKKSKSPAECLTGQLCQSSQFHNFFIASNPDEGISTDHDSYFENLGRRVILRQQAREQRARAQLGRRAIAQLVRRARAQTSRRAGVQPGRRARAQPGRRDRAQPGRHAEALLIRRPKFSQSLQYRNLFTAPRCGKNISTDQDSSLGTFVPKNRGEVPNNKKGALKNKKGAPKNKGEVPKNEGELPKNKGEFPKNEGAVPKNKGEVPKNKGAVPKIKWEVPKKKGNVPKTKKEVSKNKKEGSKNKGAMTKKITQTPPFPTRFHETCSLISRYIMPEDVERFAGICRKRYEVTCSGSKNKGAMTEEITQTPPFPTRFHETCSLISRYIMPEDVGRFAGICRKSYEVTCSGDFWFCLYRRFYRRVPSLPEQLQPDGMLQLIELRARTIRYLYHVYPVFCDKIKTFDKLQTDLKNLEKKQCLGMWCVNEQDKWIYNFIFVDHISEQQTKYTDSNLNSLWNDLVVNGEPGSKLLRVQASNYIQHRAVMSMQLKTVILERETEMQLKLKFCPCCNGPVSWWEPIYIDIDFCCVTDMRVLNWWEPLYPHN